MEKGLINWLKKDERASVFGFRFTLLGVLLLLVSAYYNHIAENSQETMREDYDAGDITVEEYNLIYDGKSDDFRNSRILEKYGFATVFLGISLLIISKR